MFPIITLTAVNHAKQKGQLRGEFQINGESIRQTFKAALYEVAPFGQLYHIMQSELITSGFFRVDRPTTKMNPVMSLFLLGNFPVAPSASFHEARHGHQKGCIAAEFEKNKI